jgi:hypothetical protein
MSDEVHRRSDLTVIANAILRKHHARGSALDERSARPSFDSTQVSADYRMISTQALSGLTHASETCDSIERAKRLERWQRFSRGRT